MSTIFPEMLPSNSEKDPPTETSSAQSEPAYTCTLRLSAKQSNSSPGGPAKSRFIFKQLTLMPPLDTLANGTPPDRKDDEVDGEDGEVRLGVSTAGLEGWD